MQERKGLQLKYYCEESAKVLKHFESEQAGLSAREAEARLAKHGPNKLAAVSYTHLLSSAISAMIIASDRLFAPSSNPGRICA